MELTKQKIAKVIQIFFIILIGAAVLAVIFFSLTSCSGPEQLTDCNDHDRRVIGYSKNKKRYKVVTGCGFYASDIKITPPDTLKPGSYLICDNEFRNTYFFD